MLEKFRRGHCDQASVDLLNGCGTNLTKLESIKVRSRFLASVRR